jgi:hypothetical protein
MEGVKWEALNCFAPPFKCLNIGECLSFEDLPETSRLAVWDDLYKESNSRLF